MSSLVYSLSWRPLRIGWCVQDGDRASLLAAFRANHCLWGGRYNPVIVIDDRESALNMLELFNVDVLSAPVENKAAAAFANSVKHLRWPFCEPEIFPHERNWKECQILDIRHPIRQVLSGLQNKLPYSPPELHLYRWSSEDPLSAVFEATVGRYPEKSGPYDYERLVRESLTYQISTIECELQLDVSMFQKLTPNILTSWGLIPKSHHRPSMGIYAGDARSFAHLVDFWNLRAANISILFLDQNSPERCRHLVDELDSIVQTGSPDPVFGKPLLGVWHGRDVEIPDLDNLSSTRIIHEVSQSTWDDRHQQGMKVRPSKMVISEQTAVAHKSEGEQGPLATLQVNIPEVSDFDGGQHIVLTAQPKIHFSKDYRFFFHIPWIPEMNDFYTRSHCFGMDEARAQKDGLGIILPLQADHITLQGIDRLRFAVQLFAEFGIDAKLSQPGLICDQLIRQMGGVQNCRVFKIPGVRRLIEKYKPDQSFTRNEAIRLISGRDEKSGLNDFESHKELRLEFGWKKPLGPGDVFDYLLAKEVFRVGINAKCSVCGLTFWEPLDSLRQHLDCRYCGKRFNITPQLKDRDWAYRRSGLFGRDDHQQGGVAVAVTLQQLDTSLHSSGLVWIPAMELTPKGAAIAKCETDFFLLNHNSEGKVEVALSECKTHSEISDRDVDNLIAVANSFSASTIKAYVVFSKTGAFSEDEVLRCKRANDLGGSRVILLSQRELEPYHIYERVKRELRMDVSAGSLQRMAEATTSIFFGTSKP